ncbi:uncharacterized protein LOC111100368 [Crassostrea virginica]|uniref:Uncharacterized protein LOC111100368 n=1 Tax=Crassostrea virginica TaxID=6565 RepID=A0A8B8A8R4_CRAVI|nr:uncharacterized protein LOC111100368 [Crassostrea virginica]
MNIFAYFAFIACCVFSLISCVLAVNIWDRASLVCANVNGHQIIDEDSSRDLYVDSACSSGEVVWRMTKSVVTLRFRRPSPFTVCLSSKAPVGFEKFGVYNLSLGNMFVGSPNIETEVCLNSLGNTLDVNLLSLRKYFVMNAYFKVICLS